MDKTPRTDAVVVCAVGGYMQPLTVEEVAENRRSIQAGLGGIATHVPEEHAHRLEKELSSTNAQLAEAQRYRSWEFIEKALAMEQARMDKVAGLFPQTAEEHRKSRIAMHDVLGTVRWAKNNKMPLPVLDAMDQTEQKR